MTSVLCLISDINIMLVSEATTLPISIKGCVSPVNQRNEKPMTIIDSGVTESPTQK